MRSEFGNLRRAFLTRSIALVGALPLAWASKAFAQGGKCTKPVNLKTNAMAKGINYKEKIDPKADKLLINADGSQKTCWNCILYTADGGDPETAKQGQCKLMQSLEDCIVQPMGGCTSWAENAALKGKKFKGDGGSKDKPKKA